MAGRRYDNFDITISPDGEGYRVVAQSQDREVSGRFDLPFEDRDLEGFLALFGTRRVRRMESPQLEQVRSFGARLYDAIFGEELDTFLMAERDAAERRGDGLRLRFHLDDAPDLIEMPLEYLYRKKADDFIALSNWTPVVRRILVDEGVPPADFEPPLRVLVMVSNPIETRDSLDVEREWDRLESAVRDLGHRGLIELERLERATEQSLARALRLGNQHVFHFIGHGEYAHDQADGVLFIEDERGRAKMVPGRALGTLLRDARSMRLAVLNNCEGAVSTARDPMSGSAQSLIQKGIPAVVAMQVSITDSAAIDFSHGLYESLGDGFPIDAAVAEARKAIYSGRTQFEFGAPVLYMSSEDGMVFSRADIAPTAIVAAAPEPTAETLPVGEVGATAEQMSEQAATEREAAEEADRLEAERKAAAKEADRLEAEQEAERLEAEKIEAERKAAEEAAQLEEERKAAEKLEKERKAAEHAERRKAEEDAKATRRDDAFEPAAVAAPSTLVDVAAQADTDRAGAQPSPAGGFPIWARIAAGVAIGLVAIFLATRGGDTSPTTTLITQTTLDGGVNTSIGTATTLPGDAGPVITLGNSLVFPPPTATIADRLTAPLTIDGSDADWASRYAFESAFVVHKPENVSSDSDLSATWRLAWDDTALYLFAVVRDDAIVQVNQGSSLFRGDAVATYFDSDPNDGITENLSQTDVAFFLAPAGGESNWVRLAPTSNGGGFGSGGAITSDQALSMATERFEGGYTIEASIGWGLIGIAPPQAGSIHRMTLDVSDNDAAGESAQQAMISNSAGRTAADQARPRVWLPIVFDGIPQGDETLALVPNVFGFDVELALPLLDAAEVRFNLLVSCSSTVGADEIARVLIAETQEVLVDEPGAGVAPRAIAPGTSVEVLVGNGSSC